MPSATASSSHTPAPSCPLTLPARQQSAAEQLSAVFSCSVLGALLAPSTLLWESTAAAAVAAPVAAVLLLLLLVRHERSGRPRGCCRCWRCRRCRCCSWQ